MTFATTFRPVLCIKRSAPAALQGRALRAYIRSNNTPRAVRLSRMMAHSARVYLVAHAIRSLYASGTLPRFQVSR
jgi:hypothetical protein